MVAIIWLIILFLKHNLMSLARLFETFMISGIFFFFSSSSSLNIHIFFFSYCTNNLDAMTYDWRLPPSQLEARDGYFTNLMHKITAMRTINRCPVVVMGHRFFFFSQINFPYSPLTPPLPKHGQQSHSLFPPLGQKKYWTSMD